MAFQKTQGLTIISLSTKTMTSFIWFKWVASFIQSYFLYSIAPFFLFCLYCVVMLDKCQCLSSGRCWQSKKNILREFRAVKRTAQVSAHPHELYLRAQVIIQAAMVCNGWKQRPTVRNTRMSFGWFIYSCMGKREMFSAFHCCWRKQFSPYLPRDSIACLYTQWVAYNYAICKECLWIKSLFAPQFLVYRGKIKC